MSTDLSDFVDNLKRAIAPPGRFDELYPDVDNTELTLRLADGMSQALLDGFLAGNDVDEDGITSETLTTPQIALVVLYTATASLQLEISNRASHVRYEAGPVVYEQDYGASFLVERLKQLDARLRGIIDRAVEATYNTDVFVADLALIAAFTSVVGMPTPHHEHIDELLGLA